MACAICPSSSDPFYIITNRIKWVTTSLTHSKIRNESIYDNQEGMRLLMTHSVINFVNSKFQSINDLTYLLTSILMIFGF